MTADPNEIDLKDFIGPALDQPAYLVRRGEGGLLIFEFGEPRLHVREYIYQTGKLRRTARVHGEQSLWIESCHWRVLQDGKQTACNEDGRAEVERAIGRLDSQRLTAVHFDPIVAKSRFTFDLGGRLETWPLGDDPTSEHWFMMGEVEAFSVREDGHYSIQPIREAGRNAVWRKFTVGDEQSD